MEPSVSLCAQSRVYFVSHLQYCKQILKKKKKNEICRERFEIMSNSISFMPWQQLTLFMSFVGFTNTRLGLWSVLPMDTPIKRPRGSNVARTQDPWIMSQTLCHWAPEEQHFYKIYWYIQCMYHTVYVHCIFHYQTFDFYVNFLRP